MLRRRGLQRVRPLLGGIQGWKERGFPLLQMQTGVPESAA